MKIAIGCDHAGFSLKESIKEHFSQDHEIIDVGTLSASSCDYPMFAQAVCQLLQRGAVERGILICGTGIGMSIAANRFHDVRTALCHDEFTARRARQHNDAQIMAMGSQVVGRVIAFRMISLFLSTEFDEDNPANKRHARRLKLIETTL